jgi:cell division protein FtsB
VILSRVVKRPRHAAKRVPPRLLRLPKVTVNASAPATVKAWVRSAVRTSMRTSVGVPATAWRVVLAWWKQRRATLSLQQRRARALVGGAVLVASLVLLTSFPISGLLSQRSAISGTAQEITTLQNQNAALASQASALANPSTVNNLARHDYGFVRNGQRAYNVLPSSTGSGSGSSESGQVPLNGPPVVPGSARSQALVGVVAPAPTGTGPHASTNVGGGDSGGTSNAEPRGYWARVVRSLEFWN